MSQLSCSACGVAVSESSARYRHNIPFCKSCFKTSDADRVLAEKVGAASGTQGRPGYSALSALLFVFAGLFLISGAIIGYAAWPNPNDFEYMQPPDAAYIAPLAWILGGILQFALFAAIGQGLHYLKLIAEKATG